MMTKTTKTTKNTAVTSQASLEEQMETLSGIVEKLENPDVPLEESLALYEQGMQLVSMAGKSLDIAEQRVALVSESGEVRELDS